MSGDGELAALRVALGEAVKALRDERGLTQADLSERAGLSCAYVNRIERGLANPSLLVLGALSRGLGVRKSELARRVEDNLEQR